MNRFTERRLSASERPTRYFEYFVTGKGDFPTDMLRYDCAWPAGPEDAERISLSMGDGGDDYFKHRSVKIRSHREPTIDRWSSFGWSVGANKL